jgi:predicted esterase
MTTLAFLPALRALPVPWCQHTELAVRKQQLLFMMHASGVAHYVCDATDFAHSAFKTFSPTTLLLSRHTAVAVPLYALSAWAFRTKLFVYD